MNHGWEWWCTKRTSMGCSATTRKHHLLLCLRLFPGSTINHTCSMGFFYRIYPNEEIWSTWKNQVYQGPVQRNPAVGLVEIRNLRRLGLPGLWSSQEAVASKLAESVLEHPQHGKCYECECIKILKEEVYFILFSKFSHCYGCFFVKYIPPRPEPNEVLGTWAVECACGGGADLHTPAHPLHPPVETGSTLLRRGLAVLTVFQTPD